MAKAGRSREISALSQEDWVARIASLMPVRLAPRTWHAGFGVSPKTSFSEFLAATWLHHKPLMMHGWIDQ
jgi:hypothetical protein